MLESQYWLKHLSNIHICHHFQGRFYQHTVIWIPRALVTFQEYRYNNLELIEQLILIKTVWFISFSIGSQRGITTEHMQSFMVLPRLWLCNYAPFEMHKYEMVPTRLWIWVSIRGYYYKLNIIVEKYVDFHPISIQN